MDLVLNNNANFIIVHILITIIYLRLQLLTLQEIRIHLPSTGQRGYSEDKSREKEMNREIFLEVTSSPLQIGN